MRQFHFARTDLRHMVAPENYSSLGEWPRQSFRIRLSAFSYPRKVSNTAARHPAGCRTGAYNCNRSRTDPCGPQRCDPRPPVGHRCPRGALHGPISRAERSGTDRCLAPTSSPACRKRRSPRPREVWEAQNPGRLPSPYKDHLEEQVIGAMGRKAHICAFDLPPIDFPLSGSVWRRPPRPTSSCPARRPTVLPRPGPRTDDIHRMFLSYANPTAIQAGRCEGGPSHSVWVFLPVLANSRQKPSRSQAIVSVVAIVTA